LEFPVAGQDRPLGTQVQPAAQNQVQPTRDEKTDDEGDVGVIEASAAGPT
jgi:hypothetical protein